MKKYINYFSAFILAGFGLLTLFMSTSVIFDLFGIRAKEGNYVLFVVLANFICGFMYLLSAYGFIKTKIWLTKLLGTAVFVLAVAFVGLFFHIQSGGIYETKTVEAMTFRTILTAVFTAVSYFTVTKKNL